MIEQGTIVKIDGKRALVEIPRKKACERCKACGIAKSGAMNIEVSNAIGAKRGDKVEVEVTEGFLIRSWLIIFFGPVVALFIGYFLGGVAVSFLLVVLYLLVLGILDKFLAGSASRIARIL